MNSNHEIVKNIEQLLNSDVTAYKIQKITGINRSTITRLKNGDIEINNISLENALKLSDLWEEIRIDKIIHEFIQEMNEENLKVERKQPIEGKDILVVSEDDWFPVMVPVSKICEQSFDEILNEVKKIREDSRKVYNKEE